MALERGLVGPTEGASWSFSNGDESGDRTPGSADRVCGRSRESTLLAAARRGESDARERLVRCHLRLVRAVASRYRGYGLPFDDLVQEGSIGLLEAIDDFEPSRGPTFERYARFRIRRSIRNALTEQSRLIRLPKMIVERRRALDRAEATLAAAGARPTPGDLAVATGLSVAAVLEARAAPQAPISLDEPVLPDGSALESVVADVTAADPLAATLDHEQQQAFERALASLSDRQRRIVAARWGVGGSPMVSLATMADVLAVSPRRAQTIGRDALYELRAALEGAGIAA
jgi:RNA polymerase sigma factor (sigma-70 family)